MSVLSGNITMSEGELELPTGCVAFIYLMRDKKSLAHQTLHNVPRFPFEFSVDVNQECLENNSNCSLRVTVERGESILYANASVPVDTSSLSSSLTIEVKPYQ